MIKGLKKESDCKLYYYINGENFLGKNKLMHGNCTDLRGDCSGLWGDCSGLRGDCTGLRGGCTWVQGSCSGLWGNLDLCEITDSDRQSKINIRDLIN